MPDVVCVCLCLCLFISGVRKAVSRDMSYVVVTRAMSYAAVTFVNAAGFATVRCGSVMRWDSEDMLTLDLQGLSSSQRYRAS